MKIVYNKPDELSEFDIERYFNSLNRYGDVSMDKIKDGLAELHYDPMHYSVLVRLGVQLFDNDKSANKYWVDHQLNSLPFDRLRRITGYLVGSLERWNDAKQAEEKARVKHTVDEYSVEAKLEREKNKANHIFDGQDEYKRGNQ